MLHFAYHLALGAFSRYKDPIDKCLRFLKNFFLKLISNFAIEVRDKLFSEYDIPHDWATFVKVLDFPSSDSKSQLMTLNVLRIYHRIQHNSESTFWITSGNRYCRVRQHAQPLCDGGGLSKLRVVS